ncbi:hypothetical protein ACJ73_08404 [Blastomyces percursus]|uniref:Uncharacterized protein n=1 Tax=Blastomyces percursus TaxID=1658174 RepID=A0A1J9QY55_9EURO|nr:hypothetical protein ACJ73_08404 [Blastomyces percursus]
MRDTAKLSLRRRSCASNETSGDLTDDGLFSRLHDKKQTVLSPNYNIQSVIMMALDNPFADNGYLAKEKETFESSVASISSTETAETLVNTQSSFIPGHSVHRRSWAGTCASTHATLIARNSHPQPGCITRIRILTQEPLLRQLNSLITRPWRPTIHRILLRP